MITVCAWLLSILAPALGPVPAAAEVEPSVLAPSTEPVEPQLPADDPFGARPRIEGELTADEAVAIALEHSPVLRMADQDIELARQMVAMVRARLAPQVSVNAWATYGDGAMMVRGAPGVEPSPGRMIQPGPSLDANFMAMLPLYTGGRLESAVRAERQRASATEADWETVRLDLALDVRRLLHQATFRQAMIDIYDALVATQAERLRVDQGRFAVGKIPEFYLRRDEAALAEARQQRVNAVRDLNTTLADLRTVLGVHPLSAIVPAAEAPAEVIVPDLAPALDLAARQRSELAAVRARILAAGADEASANAQFQPQISAFGMADLFANRRPRTEEYLVGIGIGLPLFDGGERLAEVRRARAQRAKLTAREEAVALSIANQVVAARERLLAATENLTTAAEAVEAAREDYRVAQARYAAGKSINVEVLDALAAKVRAEVNLAIARQEQAIAAEELTRALGTSVPQR